MQLWFWCRQQQQLGIEPHRAKKKRWQLIAPVKTFALFLSYLIVYMHWIWSMGLGCLYSDWLAEASRSAKQSLIIMISATYWFGLAFIIDKVTMVDHSDDYVVHLLSWRRPLTAANTNLTSWNSRSETAGFQCFRSWVRELVSFFNGREPEGVFVSKVVTGASCAVAFDERRRAEIF